MMQIVSGMRYLHTHGILHRDLSLTNLLLTSDLKVKIADFGLATQLASPGEQHFTLCGTPNYISPYVYTAVCTYILPYVHIYCRTYICTAMRTKIIAIVGICHRSYTHYTLYKSCLPICGIVIIRLLSFLFFDDFEGNANISVAIKSCFTVALQRTLSSMLEIEHRNKYNSHSHSLVPQQGMQYHRVVYRGCITR